MKIICAYTLYQGNYLQKCAYSAKLCFKASITKCIYTKEYIYNMHFNVMFKNKMKVQDKLNITLETKFR